MENDLYKIRSLGGCLSAAYDIFSTNLKHIFRRTWLPALLLALFSSAGIIFSEIGSQAQMASASSSWIAPTIGSIALTLLSYAAYTWLYTIIISLLNGESVSKNLPRIIRLLILLLCIGIIVSIVIFLINVLPAVTAKNLAEYAAMLPKVYILTAVVVIAFSVVVLPLSYSMMKYAIETKSKLFSVFKKPYIIGWKHWGYIFMVSLLAGIIILIIGCIAALPLIVTMFSSRLNTMGLAMGDASGLPSYFYILFFLAAAIFSFVMAYATIWYTCVIYYTYGHIEAKEKAKKASIVPTTEETTPQTEPDFEEIK